MRLRLEAVIALVLARLSLRLHGTSRLLGAPMEPAAVELETGGLDLRRLALLRQVAAVVESMARVLPGRFDCLPQALAARQLLGRRGISSILHLGVSPTPSRAFHAHAWLEVDRHPIVGAEELARVSSVARFQWPRPG
ncbi:MAG: lasso peptide biosynthesis B2 protein [Gemmatimonadota bacterium]